MLTDELILQFDNNKILIQGKLAEQKKSQGGFSLTLDTWTAINQDMYLGVII
jgi:hypothetical protein